MDISSRRLPIGAEATPRGVHFRVWAPKSKKVSVVAAENGTEKLLCELDAEEGGYFSVWKEGLKPGALYKLKLDSGTFPDPASRFQPEGPHGPSQVVDSSDYQWTDGAW